MRSHRKIVCLLLSVCFIAATATTAFAQSGKCSFQQLNFPPPATNGTPVALNDLGGILGQFTDSAGQARGFLLFQGKLTTFNFPGAFETIASDLSRNGIIVGSFDNGGDTTHPFMVHDGGFHEITLPGFPNTFATAQGVNANGDVVGTIANGLPLGIGYLLHKGKLTIISFPGAKGGTMATSINDEGVIVGNYAPDSTGVFHGFMWKNGVFSNIGPPDTAGAVIVNKISNSGVVVGSYVTLRDGELLFDGFAFKDGTYTKILVPNERQTLIQGVNKFGNVVGQGQHGIITDQVKGFCSAAF
jgi:probable HAF family extracellular repeat protein